MKLENINSKKFSLNTQEMGKLLGGEKIVEKTGAGKIKIGGSVCCFDADEYTYDSQGDKNAGIVAVNGAKYKNLRDC